MKIVKYIVFAATSALAFSAMADLLPPPEPPHRIGYTICVAGGSMLALAILGFGIKSCARSRRR